MIHHIYQSEFLLGETPIGVCPCPLTLLVASVFGVSTSRIRDSPESEFLLSHIHATMTSLNANNTFNLKCRNILKIDTVYICRVRKSNPSEFEILTSQSPIGLSDGLFCHNLKF